MGRVRGYEMYREELPLAVSSSTGMIFEVRPGASQRKMGCDSKLKYSDSYNTRYVY